ncbi:MAG: hypothetical protein Q8L57_03490 [bacterium]|nr:hypothetical protein [bacterium]
MINFNLLPKKEKQLLNWDAWRRFILILGAGLAAASLLFSLILIQINLYLAENLEKISLTLNLHRQMPTGSEIILIEERLKTANRKLNQIAEIRGLVFPKTPILGEIALLIPSGVKALSVQIKNDDSVEFIGLATKRAPLLSLKKTLENHPKISELSFPLANLLKDKDIEFSISFKMTQ